MFSAIIKWLVNREKSLDRAINPTKKIRIEGVVFVIRKLNPLDYVSGYQAISQPFSTYSKQSQLSESVTSDKVKKHLIDVFTAAVVEPKLTRKQDEQGIWVEALFNNIDIYEKLYNEIMIFTYGKKKMDQVTKLLKSQGIS